MQVQVQVSGGGALNQRCRDAIGKDRGQYGMLKHEWEGGRAFRWKMKMTCRLLACGDGRKHKKKYYFICNSIYIYIFNYSFKQVVLD